MLRRHQIALIAMLALMPLMTPASASAQGQDKRPETTGSASGLSPGVPQAPVGHRQPRASDIPADAQRSGEEETQIQRDRELDRELQICRNCGAPP